MKRTTKTIVMTAEAAADAAATEGRHSDYKEDDNKHVDNDDYPQ